MDMVKDEHGPEVKGFADEVLNAWSPFFMDIMKKTLPARPAGGDEGYESGRDDHPEAWRGLIALKLHTYLIFILQNMNLQRIMRIMITKIFHPILSHWPLR